MEEIKKNLKGTHEGDDWIVYEHLKGIGVKSSSAQLNALFGAIAIVYEGIESELERTFDQIEELDIRTDPKENDSEQYKTLLPHIDLIKDIVCLRTRQPEMEDALAETKHRLLSAYKHAMKLCENIAIHQYNADDAEVAVNARLGTNEGMD